MLGHVARRFNVITGIRFPFETEKLHQRKYKHHARADRIKFFASLLFVFAHFSDYLAEILNWTALKDGLHYEELKVNHFASGALKGLLTLESHCNARYMVYHAML